MLQQPLELKTGMLTGALTPTYLTQYTEDVYPPDCAGLWELFRAPNERSFANKCDRS